MDVNPVAETVRAWFSLMAPDVMPLRLIVCVGFAPAALVVKLAMGFSVGGSFVATTVSRNEVVPVNAPSPAWIVIWVVPERFGDGILNSSTCRSSAPI